MQAYQSDLAKLQANDTVVFGISMDSPAANAAFAKQIGVTFPLLSDMRGTVEEKYGILMQPKQVGDYTYEWAQRTTFVVDKTGHIRHVEMGNTAIDPNRAVSVCVGLHKKAGE